MFQVESLRHHFPALQHSRNGQIPIFLDGPAGTQVPQRAILAMVRYLSNCNANRGGVFETSRETDHIIAKAHEWMAALLNASSPAEIVFGANMTTLTMHLSRSLAKTWQAGDEILLTWLDHDANVSPWKQVAEERGVVVKRVNFQPENGMLDMDDFHQKLSKKTKLVAVTAASNVLGTLTPIPEIVNSAHEAGALVFIDAVHYTPHMLVDVQQWQCDFLACSAYKFFGPHIGILWGKKELWDSLTPYKLTPAPNTSPGRWMTGTQNHECLAGLTGTLDYLLDLGKQHFATGETQKDHSLLRLRFRAAFQAIRDYETNLGKTFLKGLKELKEYRCWGMSDLEHLSLRVPTFAITHAERSPEEVSTHLAKHHVYSWAGDMYADGVIEKLGQKNRGGVVRLGFVHYNTDSEVTKTLELLNSLT